MIHYLASISALTLFSYLTIALKLPKRQKQEKQREAIGGQKR